MSTIAADLRMQRSAHGVLGGAKLAANLRELKTGDNLLLLEAEFDSGHHGANGRYDSLKDIATEYVFLIDRLGVP